MNTIFRDFVMDMIRKIDHANDGSPSLARDVTAHAIALAGVSIAWAITEAAKIIAETRK